MPEHYKIYLASDYRGYSLKESIKKLLTGRHGFIEVIDLGCDSEEQNDYNDFAIKVAKNVREENNSYGILVCGSAHGMTIQANRFRGIRACFCPDTESARLAREHEDANVICLSSELISEDSASHILYTFFHTRYTPTERRDARIRRLDEEAHD